MGFYLNKNSGDSGEKRTLALRKKGAMWTQGPWSTAAQNTLYLFPTSSAEYYREMTTKAASSTDRTGSRVIYEHARGLINES